MGDACVLNSFSSNVSIDVESTNWTCWGDPVNGVGTICYYLLGLAPGHYTTFPYQPTGANGLHVQAHPDSTPTGSYDLQTCMVTINTGTGSIGISSWSCPSSGDLESGKYKKMESKKRPGKKPDTPPTPPSETA